MITLTMCREIHGELAALALASCDMPEASSNASIKRAAGFLQAVQHTSAYAKSFIRMK